MYTKNIDDVTFNVKKLPSYVIIGKDKIFADYAITNLKDNKVISTVSGQYQLKENSDLIKSANKMFNGRLEWESYYRPQKDVFHLIGTAIKHKEIELGKSIFYKVNYGVEIINSYNGQKSTKINILIRINDLIVPSNIPLENPDIDCYNMCNYLCTYPNLKQYTDTFFNGKFPKKMFEIFSYSKITDAINSGQLTNFELIYILTNRYNKWYRTGWELARDAFARLTTSIFMKGIISDGK